MKFIKCITGLVIICYYQHAIAQSQNQIIPHTPEIGQQMPMFHFENVKNSQKTSVNSNDFSGRWLLIDFWYRGCKTCIESLPKMNALHQEFSGKMDFLLVVLNSSRSFGKNVDDLFERLRKKMLLSIPYVYDSVVAQSWELHGYPYVIIKSPTGVVTKITDGSDLSKAMLSALMAGEDFNHQSQQAIEKPDTIQFSRISQWSPVIEGKKAEAGVVYGVYRKTLIGLYNIAFFGQERWQETDSLYSTAYPRPIVSEGDSSILSYDYGSNLGIYNYELKSPNKTKSAYRDALTKDLELFTGYRAKIDVRAMPVYSLVASRGAKSHLKSKGGIPGFVYGEGPDGGAAGFSFQNYPISVLRNLIDFHFSNDGMVYLDETGIDFNVDITIDALAIDRTAFVRELKRNKLDLVLTKKMMRVIVLEKNKLSK